MIGMSESKRRSVIVAPGRSWKCLINCFVLKPEHVKGDWCRKSRPKFALFASSEKIRRGAWAKCISKFCKFSVGPYVWYTLCIYCRHFAHLSKPKYPKFILDFRPQSPLTGFGFETKQNLEIYRTFFGSADVLSCPVQIRCSSIPHSTPRTWIN